MSALVTLLGLMLAIACFIGCWLEPELVGLLVLSNGLLHSSALDRLNELLASPRIRNPSQLMMVFGFVVAPISGFIPNTPIVAIFFPVVQGWCQSRFDVDVIDVHRDGQRLQPPLAQLHL